MPETCDRNYFQGLPIPSSAGVVVGLVWFGEVMGWEGASLAIPVGLILILCGLLMVSNFRYNSFKEVDWKGKVPFVSIIVMVLIVIMVASNPPLVLFPVFLLYLISGPVITLTRLRKLKSGRKKENKEDL